MREWVSLNGRLMPADQAQVSVFDSGFMQGVGLFETMRAYGGRVFRLQRHVDRLCQSARALGWTVVPEADELCDNVEQVVRAVEQESARVRLTVTTGSLRSGGEDPPELTVVASAAPGAKYPPELYQQGVTLALSRYHQNAHDPTFGHKTTSYFSRLAALREAHARSAFEALWLTPDGRVAEGSISSVFVVENEQILTPPVDTPVLPGITRAAMIELAVALSMPVREQALTLDELVEADEVFLTNSLMQVMPVVRVERKRIGSEKPGEVTQTLAEAYGALVREECGA